MKITKLAVKGYGPFKGMTEFPFKKGLSVVYGLNLSSGKSNNSNWVGKSLFFSSMSELLYDEPIVGLKSDKMQQGQIGLILKDKDKTVQIYKSKKFKILENGTPIEHLTKTKAYEYIRNIFPLQKSEYETFVHLDSRISHPLVMGTSTERKHFFDQFFSLDRVDEERKIYQSRLRDLSECKASFTELSSFYDKQKDNIFSKEKREGLQRKLDKYKKEYSVLQNQYNDIQTYKRLETIYNTLGNKIEKAESLCSLEDIEDKLEVLSEKKKQIREYAQQAVDYSTYIKHKKSYDQAISKLSPLAQEDDLEEKAEKYYSYKSKYDTLYEKLSELEDSEPEKVSKCEPVNDSVLEKYNKLKQELDYAKNFAEGVCPTCGQSVEARDINIIKKELSYYKKQVDAYNNYIEYKSYRKEYKEWSQSYNNIKESLDNYGERVNELVKYKEALKEKQSIPNKPVSVEKPCFSFEKCQAIESTINKKISCLKNVFEYKDEIYEYRNYKGPKDFDSERFNYLNKVIASIEAQLELDKQARENLAGVKNRLKELKEKIKDEPYLKKLIEIFSDKVIKRKLVESISKKLCDLLNKYSSLVFNTSYKFQLVWDTQIQFIVERKVGNQTLVSDVRKLSGAESKLFTVILVLSLLSFIEKDRRPTVMILDEPTANFSQETTESFIKILDILKTVIPSIVIITPRDDVYPDSYCYTVVRTPKGSSIREGLPQEVLA